jgi:hypothetical protein
MNPVIGQPTGQIEGDVTASRGHHDPAWIALGNLAYGRGI